MWNSADEVVRCYWEDDLTARQLGKMYGCSDQTILNLLHENGGTRTGPEAKTGRKWAPEQKERISGSSHWNYGRRFPEEHRRNMGLAQRGVPRPQTAGSKNGNWHGGISRNGYPYYFDFKLKERVRARDNHRCCLCGAHSDELGQALDVHHIDYNKENASLDNLMSLCRKCHTRTNNNRHIWRHFLPKLMED